MATSNAQQSVSREASGTVTKNRFVKDAAANLVARCTVAGEAACGVAKYTQVTGDEVALQRGGEIVVEAGAAVADQAIVATDSVGRAVTAVAGDAMLGKVVNGSSASAAGDLLSITWFDEPQEILA